MVTLTMAEIIPNFNIILSLVGGTFLTILSFYIPIISHLYMKDEIHVLKKVILITLLVVVTVAAVGTSYANIIRIIKIYN